MLGTCKRQVLTLTTLFIKPFCVEFLTFLYPSVVQDRHGRTTIAGQPEHESKDRDSHGRTALTGQP
jgi:hypothetical protein